MKRTELEKLQGKKVVDRMRREAPPDRYASGAASVHDRREQRRRDQAAGLVPFAVKLPADLVAALQARARERGEPLHDVVAGLLGDALGGERD